MAEKYLCCDTWFELTVWLKHIEVVHHLTEILFCPICGASYDVSSIGAHISSEHLIMCPHNGCSFMSESFEVVEEHVLRIHSEASSSSQQEGDISRSIATILRSLRDVKEVQLAKNLVLHKIGVEDQGYGCGFRNLQTVVASLCFEPEFSQVCGFKTIPSISQIQIDIERAWRIGFDPAGAAQADGELLGTRKWIGATEIATFLQYHRVKIQLVDIKLHNNKSEVQKRMIDWVKRYFNSADPPFPLYFQHEGHSRTIIGVEETVNGCNLLVYDPNVNPDRIRKAVESFSAESLSFLRYPPSSLYHKDYQIVAVRGILSTQCYEQAKNFTMFNHLTL